MKTSKRRVSYTCLLIDLLFIVFSFWISYISRWFRGNIGEGLRYLVFFRLELLPAFNQYVSLFFFFCIATLFFLSNYGLYGTRHGQSWADETISVFKAIALSTLLTVAFVFGTKLYAISRLVLYESTLLVLFFLSIWRTLRRRYLQDLVAAGKNGQNALIIGAGSRGKLLSQELSKRPYLGLKIIGFLDDLKQTGDSIDGKKVLGKINDLERIVRQKFIDEIFVTLHSQKKLVSKILVEAMRLRVGVKMVPEFFENMGGNLKIDYVGIIPLLEYYSIETSERVYMLKRLIDMVFSLLALLILSPLFMIVALLIKLDSRGPVFYISPRIGRKGKIFNFHKFRSMQVNADEQLIQVLDRNEKGGPIFKIKDDPRITRIGRFLRKHSIDELPQLWNVLKGDMSLVGPRPLPTSTGSLERYEKDEYLQKINVVPGMTSAYVIEGRSRLSFKEWVKLDLDYVEHWSLGLDLKILVKTLPAVLSRKGSY